MSWNAYARVFSRTARHIWSQSWETATAHPGLLEGVTQQTVRFQSFKAAAKSRFEFASAKGAASARSANRHRVTPPSPAKKKKTNGPKPKTRKRRRAQAQTNTEHYYEAQEAAQKQAPKPGRVNGESKPSRQAPVTNSAKKKKKKRKSKVENDLDVQADGDFKMDLGAGNELVQEVVNGLKKRAKDAGGKGGGNAKQGKNGKNQGKEASGGNQGKNGNQAKEVEGASEEAGQSSGKKKKKSSPQPAMTAADLMKYLDKELMQNAEKTEIKLQGEMDRVSKKALEQATKEFDLFWQAYGTKAQMVKIISKFPLPRYRPEFDPRILHRHKLILSPGTKRVLELALNTLKQKTGQDDWIEDVPKGVNGVQHRGMNGEVNGDGEKRNELLPGVGPPGQEAKAPQNALPSEFVAVKLEPPPKVESLSEESVKMRQAQEAARQTPKGRQMMAVREKLPSWTKKQELLDIVARNQVVVVSGETGCGKTTQLPQFILESEIEAGRGDKCSIICTQPRRLSAMSVATRVADERAEPIGQSVGYQIRLDAQRSARTKLLFCTSGVLLRKLMGDPKLDGVSHIIVDEIHERGMNEDFLLIVLKSLLHKRRDLRLILMSATLNSKLFSAYYGGAPMTHIPGFTFPVQEFFLEDALEKSSYRIVVDSDNPDRRQIWYQKVKDYQENPAMLGYTPKREDFKEYSDATFGSIKTWASSGNEKLHCGAITSIVQHICMHEPPGGILVFMTGWDDIAQLTDMLSMNGIVGDSSKVRLLPLHSNLNSESQQEIFKSPPPGIRKVVLATNIAETSITINDIVYVVNGGKAKEKSYDALNKIACLFPTWVSKASCRQRRGRAGRVQSGVCYHMMPKPMFEQNFQDHQLPEIMRTPLEELCLQIKTLKLGSIRSFLSQAMNPPAPQTINNALSLLRSIGAMDAQENMTPLGRHLAQIPVTPCVGKMILMGAMFGALDPLLTIAAATTVKDPFVRPMNMRKQADNIKQNLAAGTRSDHIALIRAYDGFREVKKGGVGVKWDFCRTNFLHCQSLEQMEQMRYQFAELLANIGFINVDTRPTNLTNRRRSFSGRYYMESVDKAVEKHSKNASNLELLRSVLCAGMFPSVAFVSNGKSNSRKPSFSTLDDGSCRPHPASVNGFQKFFPHRWLVYNDKVHTGGVFFRASTMVTDLALLLLGGDIEIQDKGNFSILDGKYLFSAQVEVTQMIADLQKELQVLLEKKIRNPSLDLDKEGGTVVAAVMMLLSNEGEPNKQRSTTMEEPVDPLENAESVVGMD
ncbi:hypothetical protein BSKO_07140 [Bryopsis sp. KO-2023]|nr:hypothetical protein BSKO_07140 [Bryopsis sp. KO-2023]